MGQIEFIGDKTSERILVEQDSYAPTGILFEKLPAKTTNNEHTFSVQVEPAYADLNKIRLSSTNNSHATIDGDIVTFSLSEYGNNTLTFWEGETEIGTTTVEYFPKRPIIDRGYNMCVGDSRLIELRYGSNDYTFSSSNPSVVCIEDPKRKLILATGVGESIITVSHPELDIKDNVKVSCDWMYLSAGINSVVNTDNGFAVKLGLRVKHKKAMKIIEFIVTDAKGNTVMANRAELIRTDSGGAVFATDPIMIPHGINSTPQYAVGDFQIHIKAQIGDEIITRSATINENLTIQ